MTDNNHQIIPPPDLIDQWYETAENLYQDVVQEVAIQAARWGADQELEACCEEMKSIPSPLGIPFGEMASNALRNARRPKPPTLKEQALDLLDRAEWNTMTENLGNEKRFGLDEIEIIRRALEALDD